MKPYSELLNNNIIGYLAIAINIRYISKSGKKITCMGRFVQEALSI